MFKRIFLFLVILALVIATTLFMLTLFGATDYLTAHKITLPLLILFCALWGTLGAFLFLGFAQFFMQSLLHLKIIHARHATPHEKILLEMINTNAKAVGLKTAPSLGIYQSPELNALSIGPSRDKAIIALSSSLLANMDTNAINAVIAHEIAYIANGDMVTLTLIQGIINAFALFLTWASAYAISLALKICGKENKYSALIYSALTVIFAILFTLLGNIAVAAFSRARGFRADNESSHLVGREKMLAALHCLHRAQELEETKQSAFAIFKIAYRPHWLKIFSTHPTLEKRIQHLQQTME